MSGLRRRVEAWWVYFRLGFSLRTVAADRASELSLIYLGATTLFRSKGYGSRTTTVRIGLGGKIFKIGMRTRTELEILRDCTLMDEYAPADDLPARIIVDLGANIGLASLRLLASHPDATIIAVEADPQLIPRLQENVKGLPVTVVHAAICGTDGEATFYRSDMFAWGNSLADSIPGREAVTVPTMTLDSLLDSQEVDRVDLLKMDIEGAEWDAIGDVVPDRVLAIIGEVHGDAGRPPDLFVERMERTLNVRRLRCYDDRLLFIGTRTTDPSPGDRVPG